MASEVSSPSHKDGSVLARFLAMSAAVGLLYLFARHFRSLDCWAVFLLVAVTAWPLWLYQRDVSLFARRIWLAGVTREDSAIRHWLWRGHLVQVLHAAAAVGFATILLALTAVLQPLHWTVIVADVLFLSLIAGPVRRRLASQVNSEQLGTVARGWPLFGINLAFLTVVLMSIDFFVGTADTRGVPWHRVAEQAFADAAGGAACPGAGWITGILATVDRLGWHASLLVIPSLSEPVARLLAWTVVLLHVGLLGYLLTRLLLGVVTWLETSAGGPGRREDKFSLAFIFTILLLALPYMHLMFTSAQSGTGSLEQAGKRIVEWTNPCASASDSVASLQGAFDAELERARIDARADARRAVDNAIDELYADVEPAVERYLDWYFTVIGEYQRLAASVGGDFASLMSTTLQQYLFEDTGFAERLDAASSAIQAASIERMTATTEDLQGQLQSAILTEPCLIESMRPDHVAGLGRDPMRASIAAGSGTAAGALTAKLLAQKTAATVAGKVAAKKSFQVAAGLAGKVAVKKGGTILASAAAATALCSPSGPLAVACGVLAGVVTWITVDKAMIEIDEALFRDEMRRDLLEALAQSRAQLATELYAKHGAMIDHAAGVIDEQVNRVFIPSRDGL